MSLQLSRLTSVVRALTGAEITSPRAWWAGNEYRQPDDPGPRANMRITALTGAVIVPLAVLVLLTGLLFGNLWRVHFFIGYLLLPIALLKMGSTSYRMVRYYLRSGPYRQVRPPFPLARITSPVLVVAVIVLFVSGIAMWLSHSQADPWGFLHTDAAIAFSVIICLHLAMYLPEALHAARDAVGTEPPAGRPHRTGRRWLVGGAIVGGLLLALGTIGFSQIPARQHHHRDRSAQVR